MLREIGFTYAHRIDPFDGGPHFQARTDAITLVRQTRRAMVSASASTPGRSPVGPALLARERAAPPWFTAVRATVVVPASGPEPVQISVGGEALRLLDVTEGDEIAYLPLE